MLIALLFPNGWNKRTMPLTVKDEDMEYVPGNGNIYRKLRESPFANITLPPPNPICSGTRWIFLFLASNNPNRCTWFMGWRDGEWDRRKWFGVGQTWHGWLPGHPYILPYISDRFGGCRHSGQMEKVFGPPLEVCFIVHTVFGLSAQTYVKGLGCSIEDALRVADDFGSIVGTHSYHHTHAYIYTMFSED